MQKTNLIVTGLICAIVVVTLVYFGFKQKPIDTANTATGTQTESSSDASQNTTTNQQPSMDTQNDKVTITVIKEGTGAVAENGKTVSVNYTGSLENGTVFDSSVDPKFNHVEPIEFTLGAGMVIKGWDQALLGMKVGEKAKIVIPASLAYGTMSPSPLIPANSTLIFEVELVGVK